MVGGDAVAVSLHDRAQAYFLVDLPGRPPAGHAYELRINWDITRWAVELYAGALHGDPPPALPDGAQPAKARWASSPVDRTPAATILLSPLDWGFAPGRYWVTAAAIEGARANATGPVAAFTVSLAVVEDTSAAALVLAVWPRVLIALVIAIIFLVVFVRLSVLRAQRVGRGADAAAGAEDKDDVPHPALPPLLRLRVLPAGPDAVQVTVTNVGNPSAPFLVRGNAPWQCSVATLRDADRLGSGRELGRAGALWPPDGGGAHGLARLRGPAVALPRADAGL